MNKTTQEILKRISTHGLYTAYTSRQIKACAELVEIGLLKYVPRSKGDYPSTLQYTLDVTSKAIGAYEKHRCITD